MKRLRRLKLSSESPERRLNSWDELRSELERSRRYGHPFVLISVGTSHDGPGEANGEADARWNGSGHGRLDLLGKLVRTTDRVWVDAGLVYLLLPASDRAVGVGLLARVTGHAPSILASADVRLVAFPEDGLTSGALLEALTQRAEQTLVASRADGGRLQATGPDLSTVATNGNGSVDGPALGERLARHASGRFLSVSEGRSDGQLKHPG